ncbi:putative Ulp1 protease family catalytic domain, papain-like cysteine peptidase superfamily [Helianthus annuus]|nr:putative Ulp1 protease family catalytic domain, papain-like cysteine peptidase superfamily [Helianthus annuus]
MARKQSQEDTRELGKDTKKAKRGRGIACFSKKIPEHRRHIYFDRNNKPYGDLLSRVRSWYGMMVQHIFPVHIQMEDQEDEYFDRLWLETKKYWKITTDEPREYMRSWAIRLGTNFRSRLVRDYVKEGLNACDTYPFINGDHWDEFVEIKTSKKFLERSKKAKASAAMNKHVPHTGRGGWDLIEKKKHIILPQLESVYKEIRSIQNSRSKLYLAGRAKYNIETQLYELEDDAYLEARNLEQEMMADGSYYKNKSDPLVQVLGPEHPGRARTVSGFIGHTRVHGGLYKNVSQDSIPLVDTRPTFCGSSYGSNGRVHYPPIMSHTECELLMNMADRLETVAYGMAWPSMSTMIDSSPISEGCVKVEVDDIVDKHKKSEVYSVTKTSEIKLVEDLVLRYVQWPRYAIKLKNEGRQSMSPNAPIVNSRRGSQSHRGASPLVADSIIHDDDTRMTPAYHPCLQMIGEDDHQLPSQLQIEDQDLFKDGFVNMLQQQTVTNAPIQVSEPVRVPEPVPETVPEPVPAPKPVSVPKPKKVRKSKLVPKPVSVPVPKPVLATVPKPKLEPHIKLITGSQGETWEDPKLNSIKQNLRNKTGLIRDVVDKLDKLFKHRTHIRTSSPQGMYPISVQYLIPYSELLNLFLRRWLDISVIHSFSMYFFLSPNSRCAFFDPYKICGAKCESDPDDVIKHIKEVYEHHEDKRYFLAPYHDNDHWKLLIFEPTTSSVFIVDSIKKGKSEESYLISKLIPSGFERTFTWTVINCYQQPGSWECGYMLIKHMWEFVETIQHDFINRKWNTQEKTSGEEIESMVVDLMERWIKEVFGIRT